MLLKLRQFRFSILLAFSLLPLSLSNPDFITLLAFKSSSDQSNSLSSWSNSSSDPSSWLGVTCDPATHRVTKLVLNDLNLTGSIEALTPLTHLRHLSLHHNRLSSSPKNLISWPNLKHLYLSHNLFAGKLPDGISHLRRLRRLDLSFNQFSGEIPMTELILLPHLLTLRLEFNSFTGYLNSGKLPSASISEFNVSSNDLAGEIPLGLSNFPATSFAGNKNLCGNPLPLHCPNQTSGDNPLPVLVPGDRKKGLSHRVFLLIILIDVVAVMAALVTLTCCCYKRGYRYRERKREVEEEKISYNGTSGGAVAREGDEMVYFEGCKGFEKVDDLLKASAEMLGKGSVGATFKVVMNGGGVLVVKRVKERRRRKEVDGFLRVIGGLRHPNLVSLRAYYQSKDELLLVYDFLPNGSLHSLLHGNRGPGRAPLDWTTRLKLAAGSAKGLAFLHSHSNRYKLFHGHLTTSNIITDHLGNSCLSDIGLNHLLQISSSPNNPYKAPELNNNGTSSNQNAKFLQKCDVYSFGVVLLEILTGKMAAMEGENRLVESVWGTMSEKWTWEVIDFELWSYKEMEGQMMALLQVALLCLAPSPRYRPKMGTVYKMIEDIGKKGDGGGEQRGGTLSPMNDRSSDFSLPRSEGTPNFARS